MRVIWIFIFLLLLPQVSAVPADFYIMEISPKIVEPGETTTLNVTLKNLAPNFASFMEVSLDPADTSPIDAIGSPRKFISRASEAQESGVIFGGIIQLEDIPLSFQINVKENATEGVHQVPLELAWINELQKDVFQTLYIGMQVKGVALVRVAKITTTPVEFRPNTENNKVTITVENAGKTTAKSVSIGVELTEPFTEAYSSSSRDFTTKIAPDESHDFTISLDIDENAQAGEYTLPLKITYRTTDSSLEVDDEINIKINTMAKFDVETITSRPDTINPGTNFIINLPVKNVGQERAESVKAVIKTKSYFIGVKTDYLGDIKVGESKLATFELTADRDTIPDNYENDIKIIWIEGDKRFEEIDSFGITVSLRQGGGGAPMEAVVGLVVLAGIVGSVVWRKLR